ncbi:hypothetical protein CSV74_12255 [Sporosarcina sp. P19]|nr:hypothetical protein CSV74_12255 [Sporosarcina sp. P19]
MNDVFWKREFKAGGRHRFAAFQADAFGRARGKPSSRLAPLVVLPVGLILPEANNNSLAINSDCTK